MLTALDLHLNDVVFLIPGIESWTTDDALNHLGEPQKISTANLPAPLSPDSNIPVVNHVIATDISVICGDAEEGLADGAVDDRAL